MSLYYTSQDANYPNVENIKKILSDSDYSSWLYCNSVNCGNARGWWWTIGPILTPMPAMIGLRAMRLTPVTCTTTLVRVRMGCVPSLPSSNRKYIRI